MNPGTYRGTVFGPWNPGKSFPAQVENGYGVFRFILEDGRTFEIPTDTARLSRGGFGGLAIVIQGLTAAGESLYVQLDDEMFLTELESANSLSLREAARSLKAAGKSTKRSWFFSSTALVILLIGFCLFLWTGINWLTGHVVSYIDPYYEDLLGNIVLQEVMRSRKKIESGPVFDAVQEVWKRVEKGIPHSPISFKLSIANTNMVNAVAAPGGYVIVFAGILPKLESPEELAGILAHEVQHALKRHGLKTIIKSAGVAITLGLVLGDSGALGDFIKSYGGKLLTLSYSRDFEREADQGAVEVLAAAGIDPTKFPAFFRRMASGTGTLEHTLSILSTHPAGPEREDRLTRLFSTLPAKTYTPINTDWEKVQKALREAPPPVDPGL